MANYLCILVFSKSNGRSTCGCLFNDAGFWVRLKLRVLFGKDMPLWKRYGSLEDLEQTPVCAMRQD